MDTIERVLRDGCSAVLSTASRTCAVHCAIPGRSKVTHARRADALGLLFASINPVVEELGFTSGRQPFISRERLWVTSEAVQLIVLIARAITLHYGQRSRKKKLSAFQQCQSGTACSKQRAQRRVWFWGVRVEPFVSPCVLSDVTLASFQHKCCILLCTCRFSGATPIASAVANSAPTEAETGGNAAPAPALTGELDSEITQLLKSLSKRDATTKFKALQARCHFSALISWLCHNKPVCQSSVRALNVLDAAVEGCDSRQRFTEYSSLPASLGICVQQASHGQ